MLAHVAGMQLVNGLAAAQEQLQVALAGRAAERLLLGDDELSTMTMSGINFARRAVQKLVLASAMSGNEVIGPQTIAQPVMESDGISQIISPYTSTRSMANADLEMEKLLHNVRFVSGGFCALQMLSN